MDFVSTWLIFVYAAALFLFGVLIGQIRRDRRVKKFVKELENGVQGQVWRRASLGNIFNHPGKTPFDEYAGLTQSDVDKFMKIGRPGRDSCSQDGWVWDVKALAAELNTECHVEINWRRSVIERLKQIVSGH